MKRVIFRPHIRRLAKSGVGDPFTITIRFTLGWCPKAAR
jgi:hypothetical protein